MSLFGELFEHVVRQSGETACPVSVQIAARDFILCIDIAFFSIRPILFEPFGSALSDAVIEKRKDRQESVRDSEPVLRFLFCKSDANFPVSIFCALYMDIFNKKYISAFSAPRKVYKKI